MTDSDLSNDLPIKYDYRRTYGAWIEVFTIFSRYATDGFDSVAAEHDIIYVHADPKAMSIADRARLKDLGWRPNEEVGGFQKYV
jgi:hypothetical protein